MGELKSLLSTIVGPEWQNLTTSFIVSHWGSFSRTLTTTSSVTLTAVASLSLAAINSPPLDSAFLYQYAEFSNYWNAEVFRACMLITILHLLKLTRLTLDNRSVCDAAAKLLLLELLRSRQRLCRHQTTGLSKWTQASLSGKLVTRSLRVVFGISTNVR